MITIDRLCYNSKLRFVNAGEKFAFAVLTLCACVISRSFLISGFVLLTAGILTVWKGGIPASAYLKFLRIPLAFLLLSSLAIFLNVKERPMDLFALSLGSFYLTGSRASLFYALQLILTALASVSCLYFLSLNTPMPDLLAVLRRLHCPKLILELMLLIYRFIFCAFRDFLRHSDGSERQTGKPGLPHFPEVLRRFGIRSIDPGHEKIRRSV